MRHVSLVIACLLCLGSARGQSPEQKQATIAYLRGLQAADGGFLSSDPSTKDKEGTESSLRASVSALRALNYLGGKPADRESCIRFVRDCFDKDSGGFADRSGGKPDVFTTAVGLMAVAELKIDDDSIRKGGVKYLGENARSFEDIRIAAAGLESIGERPPKAADWLEQLTKMGNPDGSFGKGDGAARDTGGAVAAILRLGGKIEKQDHVLKIIKAGQRDDGGFGKESAKESDLETSYRVVRTLVMLKDRPEKPERMNAFVKRCRNPDGGYGIAPGKPSSAGTTYFAAILLHWLEVKK